MVLSGKAKTEFNSVCYFDNDIFRDRYPSPINLSDTLGLLPMIDNFAHIGGFIMGILMAVIFAPGYEGALVKVPIFVNYIYSDLENSRIMRGVSAVRAFLVGTFLSFT